MKRLITAIATLSLLAGAGGASAADKMIIGIGVMHGTADLAAQAGNVNTAFASPELGECLSACDVLPAVASDHLAVRAVFVAE